MNKLKFPKLKSKAILAPMSGVTDVAFRQLARYYGASLTYTEFVHSKAIFNFNKKVKNLIKVGENEHPVGIQIFGDSIDDIIKAGKLVERDFDVIDINCGCPAWKVIKSGAGSELLKDKEKIGKIVEKLVESINKPVSVKIRTGIDSNIDTVNLAKTIEDSGASALIIHGRTQNQGFSGRADWGVIKKVKEKLNIPVIGNGDIFTPEDFKEKLDCSNVDGIMIARGSIGNLGIFKQIKDYLEKGVYEDINKAGQFAFYLKLSRYYSIDFTNIKNHAIHFTKGLKNSAKLRIKISLCKNLDELEKLLISEKFLEENDRKIVLEKPLFERM